MAAKSYRYDPEGPGYQPKNSGVKSTTSIQPKQSTFQQQQGAAYGAMDKNPYFQEYYNTLTGLQKGLGKSSGGSSGGGGGGSQITTPVRSAGLGSFGDKTLNFIGGQMENDPFGQSAVNANTRSTDAQLQQELDRIATDFGNRGQSGSPQHEAAMQQAKANAEANRTNVIQQTKEASAQYGLQVGQMATQAYSEFSAAEDRLSGMVMAGEKMKADIRIAASNANARALSDSVRAQLQIAGLKFQAATGQEDRYSNRFMEGAQFDAAGARDQRDFNYTKSFNDRAFAAQDKAAKAQKTGGILGFIGKGLGFVAGTVLSGGNPAVGAAAAGAVGSLMGGASGQGGPPPSELNYY